MDEVTSWIADNPWLVTAVVLWLVVNVVPRPHPDDRTGWKRALWTLLDRLSVLTAERAPGRVKWLLRASKRETTDEPR